MPDQYGTTVVNDGGRAHLGDIVVSELHITYGAFCKQAQRARSKPIARRRAQQSLLRLSEVLVAIE